MPSSINGYWDGTVRGVAQEEKRRAKRNSTRSRRGCSSFCRSFLLKALHVLNAQGNQYRFVPLRHVVWTRFSGFLESLGNALIIVGGNECSALPPYATATKREPSASEDTFS